MIRKPLGLAAVLAVGLSGASALGGPSPAQAQPYKACFINTYAVASAGPCFGRPGSNIVMRLERDVRALPAYVVFRAVLVSGVPATVRVNLSGGSTRKGSYWVFPAPRQLCAAGGPYWDMQLITADGQSQGIFGRFKPGPC